MSFLNELKRRNVVRIAVAYVVTAWLLIQVAETIFPLFGYGDAPARVVVIVLAIGFPLALIISWMFELTPEGLMREEDIDRSIPSPPQDGKKLDRAIVFVLVLSLGYFAFDKFVLDPARDAELARMSEQKGRSEALVESYGESSIAVLPFVNMSADPEQEYFSDGISEELLNLLAQVPNLRVISRSSSFSFKGKDIDIPSVAAQLNVAHVLEGSVRKAGNTVRITAQLIQARTDTHLWSDTFDRELNDVFAIQDEISAAIVEALKNELQLGDWVAPRSIAMTSSEAHEAYLRGRYLVVQRRAASIEAAIREFENAIAIDPDYALAHAELATALQLQVYYGDLDKDKAIDRGQPLVDRALALDPNLAEAYAAAGRLVSTRDGNTAEELALYEKAIELQPNYADAWSWAALSARQSAEPDYNKAMSASQQAARLDPLSPSALSGHIQALVMRDRLAEADIELAKLASIHSEIHASSLGFRLEQGGNYADAVLGMLDAQLHDLQFPSDQIQGSLFRSLSFIGLADEAIALSDPPRAGAYFLSGNPEKELSLAEQRLAENPESGSARNNVLMYQAYLGDYGGEEELPAWEKDFESAPDSFSAHDLAMLADFRRSLDPDADISDILAVMGKKERRAIDAGVVVTGRRGAPYFVLGLAAFMGGDRDTGLDLLAKAMDLGYVIPRKVAFLQALYDDPDFKPMLTAQGNRLTQQRHRVLGAVCNDNPYQSFWRPETGTCEAFAEEIRE